MTSRLTMPFTARGGVGEVHAVIEKPDDNTTVGRVADAWGFPVCRANVEFSLHGYDGFLGWVQLVGTRTETSGEYSFEIDPLEVFAGIDTPFAFYGLTPVLFDAPYRRDRSQRLNWIAHSFLCFAPSRPMEREVQAVTGFSWGFISSADEVITVPLEGLRPGDWSKHLRTLSGSFPSWAFMDTTTW